MELLFKEIQDSLKSGDISRLAQISFSDPILNLGLGKSKQTLIYAAAEIKDQQHCLEAIKLIIFKGGDVNYQDQDKQTVLFYLASFGKKDCVQQLLANGANPNHRDVNNQTAMFYACRESHLQIVTLLHSFGGDLSHNDDLGQIALFYAAKAGSLQIVKYMLQNGVNINHQSLGKRTALFYAKKDNKRSIVQFLNGWGKTQVKKAPKKETKKQVKKEEVYMQEQPAPPVKLKRIQKEEKLKSKLDQKQAIEVFDTKISIRLQDLIDPSPFAEPVKRQKHKDKEEREKDRERDRKLKKKKDQMNAYKLVFTDYIGFSKQITLQEFMEQHPECSQIKLILSNWQYEGGRAEQVNQKIGSNWRRPAMRLLNELWNAKQGVFFQKPVDPIRLKIYDYYDIIKQPMDLSTVKCKLITNTFSSCEDYCRSMLLIFDNCIKYNGVFNVIGQAALKLKQTFLRSTGKCEMSEMFTRMIQNLTHGSSNLNHMKIQVKRQVKEEFKESHQQTQRYQEQRQQSQERQGSEQGAVEQQYSESLSEAQREEPRDYQERELQEVQEASEEQREGEQDAKEQTLY